MAKQLVIIEAPGKLGKFQKYLGSDFVVKATVGHCVDLPDKSFAVDLKKDFEPTWEVKSGKEDIVKDIQSAAKNASRVILMTDPDREGEGISSHIYEQIKDVTTAPIVRATTSEITSAAINNAIQNCGHIDTGKVEAYVCRRILDRICGFKTSFLTQQATGGRSAGRVQSAILRIMVDREKEILHFTPEEYWILTANLTSQKHEAFTAVLSEKIKVKNEQEATKIYDSVIKSTPKISDVDIKQVNVNPFAPFTTIPMQATASTLWGWSGTRTMSAAQHLYQEGHISYHRTDSTFMSADAVSAVRAFVDHTYGPTYLPEKPQVYSSKKGAQEAHECCRVVDVTANLHLSGDEAKLYELIWKRTVACQMKNGIDERMKVTVKIGEYDFLARGNRVIFDGFRKVWDMGKGKENFLPELHVGEVCGLTGIDRDQKFTEPPSRYSIASLGKKCEDEQIGRPATFSGSIETLLNRKYITKNKNSFQPTELGMKVVDFLVDADFCFADIKFTAHMETLLDSVQSATKTRLEVLKDFWERLQKDIANGNKIKKQYEVTSHVCPKCGGFLLMKHSMFGSFYSCQNYKPPKTVKGVKTPQEGSCEYKATVGENGIPVEKVPKIKEYMDFPCQKCNAKMIKRSSKFGDFAGCSGFPKCRATADLAGVFKEPSTKKKKWFKKKKTDE